MSDQPITQLRSWREIAAEVSLECDPVKLSQLTEELKRAIDEQVLKREIRRAA